jgi:septal ring factor EnvC (AmiA/AmiB activator)
MSNISGAGGVGRFNGFGGIASSVAANSLRGQGDATSSAAGANTMNTLASLMHQVVTEIHGSLHRDVDQNSGVGNGDRLLGQLADQNQEIAELRNEVIELRKEVNSSKREFQSIRRMIEQQTRSINKVHRWC